MNDDEVFQSTKPQRLRPVSYLCGGAFVRISIHEAAKASTIVHFAVSNEEEISIHEAAKASTALAQIQGSIYTFQSTKPQRLRQFPHYRLVKDINISIHEAAKASTYCLVEAMGSLDISIHEAAKAST